MRCFHLFKVKKHDSWLKNTRAASTGVWSHVLVSCALAVVEEGSEATAVEVVQDGQQEALVELKGCGKLTGEEEDEGSG